jgi:hypothetical protein
MFFAQGRYRQNGSVVGKWWLPSSFNYEPTEGCASNVSTNQNDISYSNAQFCDLR